MIKIEVVCRSFIPVHVYMSGQIKKKIELTNQHVCITTLEHNEIKKNNAVGDILLLHYYSLECTCMWGIEVTGGHEM